MTSPETENQQPSAAAAAETDGEPDLTDALVGQFDNLIQEKGDAAYSQWGYGLFHSLSDEAVQAERIRIGLGEGDALDCYNLGCHLAGREQYAKAAAEFEKAVNLDPDLAAAIYNLALALENAGDLSSAKIHWDEYIGKCNDDEEVTAVRNHLAELASR